MRRSLFALPLLVLLVVLAAQSEQSSLPGCEVPDALRKALKDQLEPKELRLLTYQEKQERQQHVLSALFPKYPREVAPYRRWIVGAQTLRDYDPDPLTAIQTQLRERKVAHPEDPLALYPYASAIRGTDTPESIRMLEKAQSLAPDSVWQGRPHQSLGHLVRPLQCGTSAVTKTLRSGQGPPRSPNPHLQHR